MTRAAKLRTLKLNHVEASPAYSKAWTASSLACLVCSAVEEMAKSYSVSSYDSYEAGSAKRIVGLVWCSSL